MKCSLALKAIARRLAHGLGLEITRVRPGASKLGWLQSMDIRTIIDIGANTGQSALHFHTLLPNARIFSFEPLPDCYEQLTKATKHIRLVSAYNLALGEAEGEVKMYRSRFSPSSSLLKMGDLHRDAFPFTADQTIEMVRMTTLDTIASQLDLQENILVKIDVQGYEDKVIMGSTQILRRTAVLIIETSFHELYGGQPLFADTHALMSDRGFVYAGSWGQLANPKDGMPLQQDSIFVRRGWKPAGSNAAP